LKSSLIWLTLKKMEKSESPLKSRGFPLRSYRDSFEYAVFEKEYHQELAGKTRKVGIIAAIVVIAALPPFMIQDAFILHMNLLPWRIEGLCCMALFLVASFTILRGRQELTIPLYGTALFGILVMTAGCAATLLSHPGAKDFHSFMAVNEMVVTTVLVYLFAGGTREYFFRIQIIPFASTLAIIAMMGSLSYERVALLSYPAIVIIALSVIGLYQNRLTFEEFKMRKIAEHREKVIEVQNVTLSALNGRLNATLSQLEADLKAKEIDETRVGHHQQIVQTFLDEIAEPAFIIDRKGTLVFANHAFATVTGLSLPGMIGMALSILIPKEYERYKYEVAKAVVLHKRSLCIEVLRKGRVIENTVYPVVNEKNRVIYLGSIGQDITERKTRESALQFLAIHDPLTGLHNRRFLQESLGKVVALAKRGHPSVLLYLDVDNFKQYNDVYGHEMGDRVLKRVASELSAAVRDEDIASRVGGDEFAIVLRGIGLKEGDRIAKRILWRINNQDEQSKDGELCIGLSIGAVEIDGSLDVTKLVARADEAMYRAKKAGKNIVAS